MPTIQKSFTPHLAAQNAQHPKTAQNTPCSATTRVNPLAIPKRAPSLIKASIAPLRERAFTEWVDQHRQPIATVITLAVHQGWISAEDVASAFNSATPAERLYEHFIETLHTLPNWLREIALEQVYDPKARPNWPAFVTIEFDDYGGRTDLALTQCFNSWDHYFNLNSLPPALAVAIALTLELIGCTLTQAVALRDLVQWPFDERDDFYQRIRATGLTSSKDIWQFVKNDDYFHAEHHWYDQGCFEDWWQDTQAYFEPEPRWLRRWVKQRGDAFRCPKKLRKRLITQLWRWRRHPDIKSLAWFKWLRRAVLTLTRCARRWPINPSTELVIERCEWDYGEATKLAHAQPLGFEEIWEKDFFSDVHESNIQAGAIYAWWMRCDVLAWEPLRDTLEAFAIGQGLLIGAVQVNKREKAQHAQV